VHAPVKSGRGIRLAEPEEGLAIYNEKDTDVYLSFTVNSPDAVLSIALAKNNSGKYIVDTISTDGGAIPRNVALEKGLCMVDFGAWTLPEFTSKACYKPAMLMGLDKKGYIGEGADADLIIVDPAEKKPEVVISNGQIIFKDGNVVGSGTTFCSYKAGEEFYKKNNVEHITVAPEWLK
jgi:predicted amidohydrolase